MPGIANPSSQTRDARRQSPGSAFAAQSNNPFDDADYPIPDFERVYNLMRDTTKGLKLADRRFRLLTYSKCFIGEEAVQWMVDNLSVSRETAVSTGQRLMDAGIIHHVTHSEPFCDQYFFYRFQEDDDTNILNMKRIWDAAIATRHAVDVSKDLLTRLALLCEEHRKRILEGKLSATPSPAGPSLSAPSLPPVPPSTPVLPANPAAASTEHGGNAASPALLRPFSSSPLVSGNASGPMTSTPQLNRMASSPTILSATKHTVGDDVDYSTLAKSEDFRQYTLAAAELQRVQLTALNHDERIAFFVNCYNALCLHGYVSHGPPTSVIRRWIFFRGLSYRIAGLDMTLDDIEHGILRGNKRAPMIKFLQQLRPSDPKCQHVLTKRDGRIHFIISAGTRSDPPIRILDGENVQEELHVATVEFLSYSVKLDIEKRAVTLPRIFLWYADDFPTPERNLLMWVARYLPAGTSQLLVSLVNESTSAPTISYENFDWANAEARFNASVVRRKRRKLERERSSGLLPFAEQDALDMSLHVSNDGLSPLFSSNPFPQGTGATLPIMHPADQGAKIAALFPQQSETGKVVQSGEPGRHVQPAVGSESAAVSIASKTNGASQADVEKSTDRPQRESPPSKA